MSLRIKDIYTMHITTFEFIIDYYAKIIYYSMQAQERKRKRENWS